MVESSIPTFDAFCEHHDGASLSADQEYLHQYEDIVRMYASFASTRQPQTKVPVSAPLAMRWRNVGLQAIKSVASSDALASVAGRQLDVIVPILLENIWTDDEDFLELLDHRGQQEEKADTEKLLKRRTSTATVGTVDTVGDANALALSGSTADADKIAEEDIGVLSIQCLKQVFSVNNRSQIHGATLATLRFTAERVAQGEKVIGERPGDEEAHGWATKIFEMLARWTPVQDRYVILVTAMDTLVRSPLAEDNLLQQLVLATMADSLLKSDINLIGLSVMDVLLGLIQHVLRILQLSGAAPHLQQDTSAGEPKDAFNPSSPSTTPADVTEVAMTPTDLRKDLLSRLQQCIGDLATHVYYADQISDMVSAILLRLKPSPVANIASTAAAIEDPNAANAAITSIGDMKEDPNTDGFFSFDTAKVKALEAIKSILIVAGRCKNTAVGSLGRNRVPVKVWEGTQWLLRDLDGHVRKAYVDALLTWLDTEMTKADLQANEEKSKGLSKSGRNDSSTSLTKRAVSASHREKGAKAAASSKTTFLQLLHLAVYENALQYVDCESDIVLLHLLLSNLVARLGVNAVKNGLPMIFRLQEDILEAETPTAKIRIGSLCHGYFWTLSDKFNFESSPVGRAIFSEIHRRRNKMFWVNQICLPPVALALIGTPGRTTPEQPLPREELEQESLRPFDERFQMVKLISLSYADSIASPPPSAPTSPGRTFTHPILVTEHAALDEHTMPETVKEQMMSEWSKDAVIALIQASSKTVSLNGSKSGTNATGHRNFLAVNGNLNSGGTNSGSQSPTHHAHPHRSRPNSTYGLVGGLGNLQKLRKNQSPSPPSESSRNSVTRVDQLKRVLSGGSRPGTNLGKTYSDASSESLVSYDFSASETSFSPPREGQQNVPLMERSVSLREPNERARSKSRDRVEGADDRAKALASHPVLSSSSPNVGKGEDVDDVPPVPPLPASLRGEAGSVDGAGNGGEGVGPQGVEVKDHAVRKGRSVRRGKKTGESSWGEEQGRVKDLESLLKGIEGGEGDGEGLRGNVGGPPY